MLIALLLAFSGSAFATVPDAICAAPQVWDRGYTVDLTRADDGSYSALLSAVTMFGWKTRYQGAVTIEVLSPSPVCELKVTSADGLEAFDLRILESGKDQLLTVNGQVVIPLESNMECTLSQAFSEDAANLCSYGPQ